MDSPAATEVGTVKPSYRDALLRPRTFKPRFPATAEHGDRRWYNEKTMMGADRASSSVWTRLGGAARIQDHNGDLRPLVSVV
jgi:hypothetical protein